MIKIKANKIKGNLCFIIYKKTDEWYIEWRWMTTNDNEWYNELQWVVQRVTTSGTTSGNEWQRVTTNDNEWQQVTTSGTTSYNEWQRVVQRMTISKNEW